MTHCPKCGTDNRRGSRFCNECGEPLPLRTALRCPMCGTMNPVGNVYCDRCNARLIPMAAVPSEEAELEQAPIKGLSLPTISMEEERKQQVEGVTEEVEAEAREEEEDAGDWLTQLRALAVDEVEEPKVLDESIEPVEIPDWLREMGPVGVGAEAAPSQEQLAAESPVEETLAMPSPVPDETPGWLQELAPPEAISAEALTPFSEPAAEVEEDIVPAEIPDWLREIAPAEAEAPEAAPEEPAVEMAALAAAEIPDWMQEMTPVEEPAVEMAAPAAAEIPDWLQEIAPAEAEAPGAAPEEPAVEMAAPAAAEIPDWLREIAPAEAEAPEAAPEEPAVEMAALAAAEIPDWLQEIAPAEAEAPEAMPEEPAVEMAAPAAAEIPDWLQEIAPAEAEAPEAAPEEPAVEMAALAAAEIPDWLQEIAPAEAEAPEAALEEPAVEMAALAAAELPDWLQEIAPAEAPEAMPEEPSVEMAAPAAAELPDWLQGVSPPEAPEAAPPSPAPFIGVPPSAVEESPDWLREIAPDEVAAPEVAPSVPVEPLLEVEAAEASEWLTELDAGTVSPSGARVPVFEGVPLPPALDPGIEEIEGEGLARAEIPDWLEALRPSAEVAAAAVEEEQAETEGLLEGLSGVISPASAIDVPAIRESVQPTEVSEASLARAQLLQGLLAQPAEVVQPEMRKPGISMAERVQHWLVAAVLLIVVGGMLVAPLVTLDVPTLAQPVASAGVTGLYSTVQRVSAGDTVLVAFEYGPVEADELDLVAEPILRHMLDQGVRLSVVSTRPEGLAMAAGLLSDIVESEERYTEGQYTLVDYRPGDATGVSQLLAEAGTHPRLILVLAARPGPLRWWVEQTYARGKAAPLVVAGLSAALESAASPYVDVSAGQLEGVVSGLSGAAAYESLRGVGGQATLRLDALAMGHVAIVGLMILGAVFYALSGSRGRTK